MTLHRGYSSPSLSTVRSTVPASASASAGGLSRQSSRSPLSGWCGGGWRQWALSILVCAAVLSVITLFVHDTVQISRYYVIMQHHDVSYEMVVNVPPHNSNAAAVAAAAPSGDRRAVLFRPLASGILGYLGNKAPPSINRRMINIAEINEKQIMNKCNISGMSSESGNSSVIIDNTDNNDNSSSNSSSNMINAMLDSISPDNNDTLPVQEVPLGKLDKWGKPLYSADYRALDGAPPLNGYNFTLTPRCDLSDPCSCCFNQSAANRSRDGCPTLVLIGINAQPSNFMRRDLIRRTYLNQSAFSVNPLFTIRHFFVLGTPANDSDSKLKAKFEEEWEKHGDLLQGEFIDSYANLSLKSAALVHYAAHFCAGASYVLKIDSDVFLNTPNLLAYIEEVEANVTRDGNQSVLAQPIFHCRWQEKDYVIRAWRKNNVSMDAYSMGYYPPYCSGYAYLMNIHAVRAIAAQAQVSPFFANEDVLMTGFLALKAGVKHVNIRPKYFHLPDYKHLFDFSLECRSCVAMGNMHNHIFAHAQLYANWPKMWTYLTTTDSAEKDDLTAECIAACPMFDVVV